MILAAGTLSLDLFKGIGSCNSLIKMPDEITMICLAFYYQRDMTPEEMADLCDPWYSVY